jgi:hypothetical protein
MFQSDLLECCCRQSVDWINFEFYEGKTESKIAKDKEDVSRAKQKDLVTFAPAIRLGYSIMGGRRSSHWLKSKATYDTFHNKKAAERKSEEVRVMHSCTHALWTFVRSRG